MDCTSFPPPNAWLNGVPSDFFPLAGILVSAHRSFEHLKEITYAELVKKAQIVTMFAILECGERKGRDRERETGRESGK